MRKALFLALFLMLIYDNAIAGWYQVANYVGTIGKYPVHISIQKYDSFGSKLTIEGSYYYDKNMSPIPLYGKYTNSDTVEICEIHNDDEFEKIIIRGSKSGPNTQSCPFKLTITENGAYGTWASNGAVYDVTLRLTAILNDTGTGLIKNNVEIPYWGQTKNYMFIGVYEKAETGITVNKIKVMNKSTKNLIQELDPQEHDCSFGFFMTPIYMNVESYRTSKAEQIILNCSGPKGGDMAYYLLDKTSNKFRFSLMR